MHLVGFIIRIYHDARLPERQIREYRRNCLQHVNKMSGNRLPRVLKKLQTKRQKEPGETIKETWRRVTAERVNRWPNCMLARLLLKLLLLLLLLCW